MTKKDWLLILSASFLFSAAFPPLPLGFLAYFFLFPLLIALEDASPRRGFKLAYFFGLISNFLLLYWIAWQFFYGETWLLPGSIGALFILAIYPGIWGWLYCFIKKKFGNLALILAPFLWVSLEWVRSLWEIGFPWLDIGYTQTNYLSLIQFSSLTGIFGVSLWVIFLNIFFYLLVEYRKNLFTVISVSILIVLLILVPYLYGRKALTEPVSAAKIKVALIQGNIDMNVKWNPKYLHHSLETFYSLTQEAATENPELIIWPETSAPCYLAYEPFYFDWVKNLSDSLNIPIVLGTDDYQAVTEKQYVFYNSVFYFQPQQGLANKYYKMQLVPFAEKLPLSGKMRVLNKIQLGQANFSSGENYTLFDSPKGKFATLVCFEIVFPNFVRKFVQKKAGFIVNITNDGWFGKTVGPYQHASMSIMRAIENRISIARCANSGISMLVDPYGRIIEKTTLFQQVNLIGEIPLKNKETFYTRNGNITALVSFFLSLVFLVLAKFKR